MTTSLPRLACDRPFADRRANPLDPARAATPARPSFTGGLRVATASTNARHCRPSGSSPSRAPSPDSSGASRSTLARARAALDLEPALAARMDTARDELDHAARPEAQPSLGLVESAGRTAAARRLERIRPRRRGCGSPSRDRGASGPARRRCRVRARTTGCRRRTRILRGTPARARASRQRGLYHST